MKRIGVIWVTSALLLLLGLSSIQAETGPAKESEINIFQAARQGDIGAIEAYKKTGGSLDVQNEKGFTPVILAAYNHQYEAVNALIRNGADPCKADANGQTALMGVAFHGYVDIAKTLISRCDVNATSRAGQTALMFSAMFGRFEMAEFLLKHGANANTRSIQGQTALDLAKSQGNDKMAQLLSKWGT